MRYRIHQVKIGLKDGSTDFSQAIRRQLKKPQLKISDVAIVKESIDARKKPDVKLVYTLDFSCEEKLPLENPMERDYDAMTADLIRECRSRNVDCIHSGQKNSQNRYSRPVVAGFGPCGMFAALMLAEAGLSPVVLERGEPVDDRIRSVEDFWNTGRLNPNSNVQFGEGGAGTFSDGKLTTGIKDTRISKVLKELVQAGADDNILYKQKPHIGTDRLRDVVKAIRHKILDLGGEIRFNTRLDDLILEEKDGQQQLVGIRMTEHREDGRQQHQMKTDTLILAIGHSARDTFAMLHEKGLSMEQKPFSIGVRIRHLQSLINRSQYGDEALAQRLGAADYKLNHRCRSGRGVYTFCMCPGGMVINAASEPDMVVTNGMSNHARDGKYANSGLLVDVRCSDFSSGHPLAGMEFQRKYEKLAFQQGGGRLPETNYGRFRDDEENPVRNSLPDFAVESILEAMPYLGKKLKGFDSPDALMTAVETRSSSPVRILRDSQLQTSIAGIYPAGEGPGYAGGIVSAAVDGIKAAEKIIESHCREYTVPY